MHAGDRASPEQKATFQAIGSRSVREGPVPARSFNRRPQGDCIQIGGAPSKLTRGYNGRVRIQPVEKPLMDGLMPSSLVETLDSLEDPRVDRTKLHHLTDILALSVPGHLRH